MDGSSVTHFQPRPARARMIRLWRGWFLVRDTGRSRDYPPRAYAEMVAARLRVADLETELLRELRGRS